MSGAPHSIGRDQTLDTAHAMMHKLGIRHLPVLEAGRLVGLLSQRDLYLVETLRDVDPKLVTVDEAMSQDVYQVTPSADLHGVVRSMIEHKYGCAVVMEKDRVVGIFTTVDAMRALQELLGTMKAGA
ncbi:MAG TPA: CBS domain-containing protein [Labilithrix sp.]|nr:CBS domain-containing protein [Labilithrix sp.]